MRAAVESYEGGTDDEDEDNEAGLALKALTHIGSGAPGAASGLDRWAGLLTESSYEICASLTGTARPALCTPAGLI